jgi:hypothetical protein
MKPQALVDVLSEGLYELKKSQVGVPKGMTVDGTPFTDADIDRLQSALNLMLKDGDAMNSLADCWHCAGK